MILLSPGHRGMKFCIKDFFIKCDQICNFLRIWSHLLQKALMENFIFVFALRLVSKKGGGDYSAGENLQKIIKCMINSKSTISIISWNNALLSLMLNLKRYKHINLIPYLLHKKWSFPSWNSSLNVTKLVAFCRLGDIYWINFNGKLPFLCSDFYDTLSKFTHGQLKISLVGHGLHYL